MLGLRGGVESKLYRSLSLTELGEEITGPRWLGTGICRALQGAHSCPWLRSPEDMSRARTPCNCAFRNRAVSRPLASPASSSQSSRAQLIVLALFWELDSSRGMPPLASGSTCVCICARLTGGALILRRVRASTIQTSANARRARWGSPHGPLQQRAR